MIAAAVERDREREHPEPVLGAAAAEALPQREQRILREVLGGAPVARQLRAVAGEPRQVPRDQHLECVAVTCRARDHEVLIAAVDQRKRRRGGRRAGPASAADCVKLRIARHARHA